MFSNSHILESDKQIHSIHCTQAFHFLIDILSYSFLDLVIINGSLHFLSWSFSLILSFRLFLFMYFCLFIEVLHPETVSTNGLPLSSTRVVIIWLPFLCQNYILSMLWAQTRMILMWTQLYLSQGSASRQLAKCLTNRSKRKNHNKMWFSLWQSEKLAWRER